MSPINALVRCWERALVFQIGANDSVGIGQLPPPEKLPDLPFSRHEEDYRMAAADALGEVLGLAFLKLHRPWPSDSWGGLDGTGIGWLCELGSYFAKVPAAYRQDARLSCEVQIGRVLDVAINAPPPPRAELLQRLDDLDNEELHRLAMRAVKGEPLDFDLFEGMEE